MKRALQQNSFGNLLVVFCGKIPARWMRVTSRLHSLLEGVDSLGDYAPLSHPVSTLNDEAKRFR